MKSFGVFVILTICSMTEANNSGLIYHDSNLTTPALLFTGRNFQFYIVPNKKYKRKELSKHEDTLLYTCPASEEEIKSLKTSKKLENEEKFHTAATSLEDQSKLQAPSSSNNETELLTSPSTKNKPILTNSSPSSKNNPESQNISSPSKDEGLRPPSPPNNHKEKDDDDDHDDFTDSSEILDTLASPVEARHPFDPPTAYFCQKNYKPQKALVGGCGRLRETGAVQFGRFYSISYKIKALVDGQERRSELFVYAKCASFELHESFYVMYKIIPSVSDKEPDSINYDQFDPTEIYHKKVYTPYYMDEQKDLLNELDDEIMDDVIPQRLIPAYSIAENYSKGTVLNDHTIFRPQWRSKAKIWDDLTRAIYGHGKMLKWIICTGTVGTLLTKNNKPLVIKSKQSTELTIPLFWWTLITKTDSKEGEGILIGMLNVPKTSKARLFKNYKKLCSRQKTCVQLGWEEIINDDNSDFVICCEVTGSATSQLIGYGIELYVLSLEIEIKNEMEQDRVRVNTLLEELPAIGKMHLKRKAALEKQKNGPELPSSPLPSSPNSDVESSFSSDFESLNISPISSPERPVEAASKSPDRSSKIIAPKPKSRNDHFFSLTNILDKFSIPKVRNLFSKVQSPIPA